MSPEASRAKRARSNANRRVVNRQLIHEAKSHPCADCRRTYPYYIMDLDHRPDEVKLFELSTTTVLTNKSPSRVKEEIAKCDPVCSNCHRERTHQRDRQEEVA